MTDNLNYINLTHNINNTRIYKMDKEFFAYTATQKNILAYSTLFVNEMAQHILEKIQDENCEVNLMFGHKKGSLSKNKQKKLKNLLKEDEVNIQTLKRWVSMLL